MEMKNGIIIKMDMIIINITSIAVSLYLILSHTHQLGNRIRFIDSPYQVVPGVEMPP
jgi:hypothetical protein